jgi:hypothetical protein
MGRRRNRGKRRMREEEEGTVRKGMWKVKKREIGKSGGKEEEEEWGKRNGKEEKKGKRAWGEEEEVENS